MDELGKPSSGFIYMDKTCMQWDALICMDSTKRWFNSRAGGLDPMSLNMPTVTSTATNVCVVVSLITRLILALALVTTQPAHSYVQKYAGNYNAVGVFLYGAPSNPATAIMEADCTAGGYESFYWNTSWFCSKNEGANGPRITNTKGKDISIGAYAWAYKGNYNTVRTMNLIDGVPVAGGFVIEYLCAAAMPGCSVGQKIAHSSTYQADGSKKLSQLVGTTTLNFPNADGPTFVVWPAGSTWDFAFCVALRDANGKQWAVSETAPCSFLPPLPPEGGLQCSATAPNILDLGTVEAGGDKEGWENVSISCQGGTNGTASALVTFTGIGGDSNIAFTPSGGLTGILYVVDNNRPGSSGATVSLGVGLNQVAIGAGVHATDQAVGVYTATGVVRVDYK